MNSLLRPTFFIGLTLLFALMLMILPLPQWAQYIRPLWAPLVVFYWAIALPEFVSVSTAFVVGLAMDSLLGTPLGEQALLLTLATYIMSKFHQRIRLFPLWQQSLLIFGIFLGYFALQFWIQVMVNQPSTTWMFWLSTITSALLWPWVFIILRDYRRRTGIS